MFRALLLLLCFSIFISANAQFFPGEGDVVNYRLVGFTIPKDSKAEKYLFEVAEYSSNDKGNITTRNAIKQVSDSNRTVIMMPHFDKGYTWRVSFLNKKGKVISSTPYSHFRTGKYPTIDSTQFRINIIDSIRQGHRHDDIYILLDFISVIYDLDGNPIWYLPDIPLVKDKDLQMRDLKPTADGTFTATTNFGAFEMNYNGKLLWKGPNDGKVNGDTMEYYHHEFTKLDNGNYMAASLEYEMRKMPDWVKVKPEQLTPDMLEKRDDGYYKKITTGNLIEYDQNKKVVWSWRSLDHFTDDDFFRKRAINGINTDMHLNAFDFDEENKVIYMSFRNTNEIVKIEYPSGKILKRYGATYSNDTTENETRLFYGQHCVRKEKDGRIYLFNNNSNPAVLQPSSERLKAISQISVFEENNTKAGLEKVWEFACDIDTFADTHGGAGGSVMVLDDGCILASMGSASRIFIVNKDKKIIWNAIPQSGDPNKNWYPLGQYRVSFIKRKDIDKFIFR